MPITVPAGLDIDTTTLLEERLEKTGIKREAIARELPRLAALQERLRHWQQGNPPSFYHLPFRNDNRAIAEQAAHITKHFARTVVLGTGGSSLGGEALVRALGGTRHPVTFYDNIDPTTLAELEQIDWSSTALLVVSKSGDTAETLIQFLALLPLLEKQLGKALRDHVRVITENDQGALAGIAKELGLDIIAHPPVGGRFSALSVVGLLPAAIAGVDIDGLLGGARAMAEHGLQSAPQDNPAFFHGIVQYLHAEQGRKLCVFMPYADRLRSLGLWYRQLWAESLGKRGPDGKPRGLTPVFAMGATDQHSQLQLYLDGPDDKQFTLLADPRLAALGTRVPQRFTQYPAAAPLVGHTAGELLLAEFRATRETLTRHARPNRTILFDTGSARAVGALMLMLELETVVVAELLGVDAFDQPAVEEGKVLARRYLQDRPA